jgi:hypothetical protein
MYEFDAAFGELCKSQMKTSHSLSVNSRFELLGLSSVDLKTPVSIRRICACQVTPLRIRNRYSCMSAGVHFITFLLLCIFTSPHLL